ncbi:MAG TPA: hypothetical protein VNU26_16635, partial [Mycobacteriales bacterium]|nr:hypothetical protein [Mycobacteriales bacterium]
MTALTLAPYGPTGTGALRDVVQDLQRDDSLSPVDVVVPSAVAGMTVRRQLADPGLANVRFSSLPQLVERLARRHLALTDQRPLTSAARSLAVRAAIADGNGVLATAAGHPQTAAMLEALFAELDAADVTASGGVQRLRDAGRQELADIYSAYRKHIGAVVDDVGLVRAAAHAVQQGVAPPTTVVLYAPRRLSEAEVTLLEALRDQDRLRAVVCTPAVPDVISLLERLLGPPVERQGEPVLDPEFVVAPDAEEEVRIVIRRIVRELRERPRRPERIAVGYRSQVPYVRLLSEQLKSAGIPHHVPEGRQLPETVAGRLLLRLLDLPKAEFPRADVIQWLTDGPVVRADGRLVPVARWDRLSRDAGVSRGLQNWRD